MTTDLTLLQDIRLPQYQAVQHPWTTRNAKNVHVRPLWTATYWRWYTKVPQMKLDESRRSDAATMMPFIICDRKGQSMFQ